MSKLSALDQLGLVKSLALNARTLFKSPYWSTEKIEAYQVKHLKARLEDAQEHVGHYQRINLPHSSEIQTLVDWAQVPILTKQMLKDADLADLLNKNYNVSNLIESKSSGSTGESLSVYYDKTCFYYHMMVELRFFFMNFNYLPWYKQTYLYTLPHAYDSYLGLFRRKFMSTLTPISLVLEELRNNPPDVLVSYPSFLRTLVDEMTEEDFKHLRLKGIGVNSEMSSAHERRYLSEKFNAPIFDDYSSEELIWIAAQCSHQQYHIFDDINYIEIVDDFNNPVPDGCVGHIVGSNLLNRAMPFLRYVQGDKGAIRSSQCGCGRTFKILEKLEGRKYDMFILPDGKILSPGYLLDLTDAITFNYSKAIRAFRLIQENPTLWRFQVVPGQNWHSELGSLIISDFQTTINKPEINIILNVVENIPRMPSGKHLPVISHWMRSLQSERVHTEEGLS